MKTSPLWLTLLLLAFGGDPGLTPWGLGSIHKGLTGRERVVVGVEEQDRQALGDLGFGGLVNEDPILQLALPLDPARDHDALGHTVIVLGKHAP